MPWWVVVGCRWWRIDRGKYSFCFCAFDVCARLFNVFGSCDSMPYCEAVILEALRLFMAHTFGIPHRAMRDTKLRGYDIPKVGLKYVFHSTILNI